MKGDVYCSYCGEVLGVVLCCRNDILQSQTAITPKQMLFSLYTTAAIKDHLAALTNGTMKSCDISPTNLMTECRW